MLVAGPIRPSFDAFSPTCFCPVRSPLCCMRFPLSADGKSLGRLAGSPTRNKRSHHRARLAAQGCFVCPHPSSSRVRAYTLSVLSASVAFCILCVLPWVRSLPKSSEFKIPTSASPMSGNAFRMESHCNAHGTSYSWSSPPGFLASPVNTSDCSGSLRVSPAHFSRGRGGRILAPPAECQCARRPCQCGAYTGSKQGRSCSG